MCAALTQLFHKTTAKKSKKKKKILKTFDCTSDYIKKNKHFSGQQAAVVKKHCQLFYNVVTTENNKLID